jgi:hypothetical protein
VLYTGNNIPLQSGLSAEGGRLLHYFTTDKEKECGVLITSVEVNKQTNIAHRTEVYT